MLYISGSNGQLNPTCPLALALSFLLPLFLSLTPPLIQSLSCLLFLVLLSLLDFSSTSSTFAQQINEHCAHLLSTLLPYHVYFLSVSQNEANPTPPLLASLLRAIGPQAQHRETPQVRVRSRQ
ncbi:hypothetical protein EDD21DRAFT_236725 [Dissophora ornata]|nr:hypothetical protein EDD21DRAFT_236725 [Dissophora ornata]